jgi:octaprenyl-diphosphate synthase
MTFDELRDHFHEELDLTLLQGRRILRTAAPGYAAKLADVTEGRGKAMRALMLLLFSRNEGSIHPEAPFYAAGVELLHLASLIHDDVIDDAAVRRNQPAAYRVLGRKMAVLTGDYISLRVLKEVEKKERPEILRDFLFQSTEVVEGEISQTLEGSRQDLTEEEYLGFIQRKTSSLFVLAARTGALLAGRDIAAAESFGLYFGAAFQIADDVRDFTADAGDSGKEPFTDARNGIMTLPLIHFRRQGGDMAVFLELADRGDLQGALALLHNRGSLEYAAARAVEKLARAGVALEGCFSAGEREEFHLLGSQLMARLRREGVLHGV